LIPDTCTHQWTCIYCEVEKIEQRERSTGHRSTGRDWHREVHQGSVSQR
jgi:hypothetical protein